MKEKKEKQYANRFFLFLLVMAIIGALSSCGFREEISIHDAKALEKQKQVIIKEDSLQWNSSFKRYNEVVYKLDSDSGFYIILDK